MFFSDVHGKITAVKVARNMNDACEKLQLDHSIGPYLVLNTVIVGSSLQDVPLPTAHY